MLVISKYLVNEQIRDKELLLIDQDGEKVGIVSGKEAQNMADEQGLDLVKIAPKATPPVARIMDYSKFRYEQEKKRKEERKNQKRVELKEVRMSPNIEAHDLDVRKRKAIEFLKDGDRVKVTIHFRHRREMGRQEHARHMMDEFAEAISEYGTVEIKPRMESRNMVMFLEPIKS